MAQDIMDIIYFRNEYAEVNMGKDITNCGIYAKRDLDGRYRFYVSYEDLQKDSYQKIIEQFFYKDAAMENVFWVGYRFSPEVIDDSCKIKCMEYLENYQLTDMDDDNEFLEVEYSTDSITEEELKRMLLGVLRKYGINRFTVDILIELYPTNDRFISFVGFCLYRLLPNRRAIRDTDLCITKSTDAIDDMTSCIMKGQNIVVVDALNSTPYTVELVIENVRKYNSNSNIYVFKFDMLI